MEELVAVLREVALSVLQVVVDAVGVGFEANSEEGDLYAGPTLIWMAKMGETCCWRPQEGVSVLSKAKPLEIESSMVV